MRFLRQEYWSGLPLPSPGDRPRTGIEPMSPTLACGFFTTEPPGRSYTLSFFFMYMCNSQGFPGGAVVKKKRRRRRRRRKKIHLPMQDMRILSLGQEDPLEKEMASHSSILAWEILWIEEPGGLQSMGSQKSWT